MMMGITPGHVNWLSDTGERLKTADGKTVEVWELNHQQDDKILSEWASHFRRHYCSDNDIDDLREDIGCSRKDYLKYYIFPDQRIAPGPSIRAGDFGEILVADYLEYLLGYWVPRSRYDLKIIKNESSKGCDTIGFFFVDENNPSPDDIMTVFESKARLRKDHLTREKSTSGFQSAINDSAKDYSRIGESLNYLKRRFYEEKNKDDAAKIGRFQNPHDRPYKEKYGAAAIISNEAFIEDTISQATTMDHQNSDKLVLMIIRGNQLMDLVHALYQRAADEA